MPLRIKETSYCGICPILNDCMNDGNWQTCNLNKYLMKVNVTECNEREFYIRVIKEFGINNQKIKAIEEMSELQKELCKDIGLATQNNNLNNNIAEEIADVEIMLEQLKIIFNRREIIDIIKESKLKRLKDMLEGS